MNNYAAAIIGIDEYQFFQPLKYAKQDGQALENFLVEEAGFAPDRCLLLTATSPSDNSHSTYPNRQTILSRIDDLCRHQQKSGDNLWVFFSGYGVMWEGEDYLMPIDGNPADIPGSGISVRSLFRMLQSSAGETLLVLLDLKRAPGDVGVGEIGIDTVKLASEMEIATVLSCQPNQSSGETDALQHSYFTAGLLEGLRSGKCRTLNNLEKFLGDRVPQLCEENFSPKQEPLFAVNPPAKRNLIILPDIGESSIEGWKGGAVPLSQENGELNTILPKVNRNSVATFESSTPIESNGKAASDESASTPEEMPESVSSATTNLPASEETEGKGTWVGKLAMGIVYVTTAWLVVMLGVLTVKGVQHVTRKLAEKPAATSALSKPVDPKASKQQSTPNQARETAQQKLDKASLLLESVPASQFSKAIAQAQQIPKNDPLHDRAQKNIDRWAMAIADIALGQAQKGQYENAIATSRMVPKDRQEAYGRVQPLIPVWQEQYQLGLTDRKRLQEAQKLIKPGMASSYSQAIAQARKISTDRPQYRQARQLIDQWSDKIWAIAQTQARGGRIPAAIQAAKLVPKDSKAYPAAQKALTQWQRKR